jgi:predicted transcriptional regulator
MALLVKENRNWVDTIDCKEKTGKGPSIRYLDITKC